MAAFGAFLPLIMSLIQGGGGGNKGPSPGEKAGAQVSQALSGGQQGMMNQLMADRQNMASLPGFLGLFGDKGQAAGGFLQKFGGEGGILGGLLSLFGR